MSAAPPDIDSPERPTPMSETATDPRAGSRYPLYPALPCRVTVQGYGGKGAELAGLLRQISAQGALLRLQRRVPPGALVTISIETGTGLIQLEAEIRWATAAAPGSQAPAAAHGVQFTASGAETDPVIEELIRHYATTCQM